MKSSIFTYLTSFIFGAAAGAVFALLSAPQSGKRTRAQIRNEISDVRHQTKKAINGAQAQALDKLDNIQDRVREIGDEVKEQTERLQYAWHQMAAKPKAILVRAK